MDLVEEAELVVRHSYTMLHDVITGKQNVNKFNKDSIKKHLCFFEFNYVDLQTWSSQFSKSDFLQRKVLTTMVTMDSVGKVRLGIP